MRQSGNELTNTTSADESRGWTVNMHDRPAALEVVLLKRSIVLSWSQFLYAEGSEGEVRAVFATHDVVVRGSGLNPLMTDLAAQRVSSLNEPSRPDRFYNSGTHFIREIVVQKVESGQG